MVKQNSIFTEQMLLDIVAATETIEFSEIFPQLSLSTVKLNVLV